MEYYLRCVYCHTSKRVYSSLQKWYDPKINHNKSISPQVLLRPVRKPYSARSCTPRNSPITSALEVIRLCDMHQGRAELLFVTVPRRHLICPRFSTSLFLLRAFCISRTLFLVDTLHTLDFLASSVYTSCTLYLIIF